MTQLVETKGQASEPDQKEDNFHQFLTFYLKEDLFCLPIESIKEIIGHTKLTPVPMVPDFIQGVINLRGLVVPVIDLSARFGWEPSKVTKRSCIVILEIQHEDQPLDIGIAIDSVSEVIEQSNTDIEPAPSFGTKIRTDFISNMIKIKEEFVVVLDIVKVLSVSELSTMQEVSAQELGENENTE